MTKPRNDNSKMTEPRIEAALEALRYGCTRTAASGVAGVTRQTFYVWMLDPTFRDEVEKAEAVAEAAYTRAVAEAVPKNWQAAAWWMERRKWQDYGRHDRIDVDMHREAERLAADLDGVTADELIAEAQAIARGKA
jgi:hypothetical protein